MARTRRKRLFNFGSKFAIIGAMVILVLKSAPEPDLKPEFLGERG